MNASLLRFSCRAQPKSISTICRYGRRNVTTDFSSHHPPAFSLSSKDVRVLADPKNLYKTLLDMVKRAKKRIFLSSLYIGTEETELIQTLHDALGRNPSLKLSLLLDLRRCTRPGPSTAEMLIPLLNKFPNQAEVHMFQSPKLKGLMAKLVPRRFDEGWGTWHAKIYGVDDEVMFSGANLNTSYFTNRQDRYLHFSNQPVLSTYCVDFMRLFSTFSFRLLPSESAAGYELQWTNSRAPFDSIENEGAVALEKFSVDVSPQPQQEGHDTLLWPLVQCGPFHVNDEEDILTSSILPNKSRAVLDLTSGYFGLHEPYQRAIIDSQRYCRVLAAGPKANGFYGSQGVSGRIPEAYTLFEQRFWRKVSAAGLQKDRISLSEWEREGWTYHAKGIWEWPSTSSVWPLEDFPLPGPTMTIFGSTNLNSRSAYLDTELSFMMTTRSDNLRQELRKEVMRLRAHAVQVDDTTWAAPERRVRLGTRLLLAFMGSML